MFNQRGQAFSVFELMIAAIVAIAILFVLLPIVTNITTPTGDAATTIGNALSSTQAGSSTETAVFEVKAGQGLNSAIFADKGIDPCSIYFDAKAFSTATISQVVADADYTTPSGDSQCTSRFKNQSSGAIRSKATVVCDTSPNALDATLTFLKLNIGDAKITVDPVGFWGNLTDDFGYTKVCVVILKRA